MRPDADRVPAFEGEGPATRVRSPLPRRGPACPSGAPPRPPDSAWHCEGEGRAQRNAAWPFVTKNPTPYSLGHGVILGLACRARGWGRGVWCAGKWPTDNSARPAVRCAGCRDPLGAHAHHAGQPPPQGAREGHPGASPPPPVETPPTPCPAQGQRPPADRRGVGAMAPQGRWRTPP